MGEALGDVKRGVICGIRMLELPKIGILDVLVICVNINDILHSNSG
jgi:hypothetical protein